MSVFGGTLFRGRGVCGLRTFSVDASLGSFATESITTPEASSRLGAHPKDLPRHETEFLLEVHSHTPSLDSNALFLQRLKKHF